MNNNEDNRTDEQKQFDASTAHLQDAADAFALLAEAAQHVAMRFRLVGDPLFMARPTPSEICLN